MIRFYATCTVPISIATESWLIGATEVAFAHFYARHLKLPGRKLSNEARKPSKANSFQQRPSTGSQPEAILLKPELKHSQPSCPPPKMEPWKIVVGLGYVWMSRLPGIDWCRQREASATKLVSLACTRLGDLELQSCSNECQVLLPERQVV